MEITQTIYEDDFIVNFETKIGWFKAIRERSAWMFYFGQQFLGKFTDSDKCRKYVENLKISVDFI